MSETFVEAVRTGRAHWTDIDDWIDRWHDGDDSRPLAAYLGLSDDEYALWVHDPQTLRLILLARELNRRVSSLLAEAEGLAIAARNLDPDTTRELAQWLRETGRLPH
jgi:hypothetical protein